MFFPERIKSIKKEDKVLEVGPGNTPFYRSNVLLEKRFEDENVAIEQSGRTKKVNLKKEIIYYDGNDFPFEDNSFDYIICAHVLEHIPKSELEHFLFELTRVSKKGYIEVPLYNFEFIANLKYHENLVYIDKVNRIHFLSKDDVDIDIELMQSFRSSLTNIGFNSEIIPLNLEIFGNGFEFNHEFKFTIHQSFDSFYDIVKNEEGMKKIRWTKDYKYYIERILSLFNPILAKQRIYNRFKVVL